MYNDLYIKALNDVIFWESIDLALSSIDMNDGIAVLLEDGETNSKQANIVMRAVDAIMKKIKEIIDWIKGIFSDKSEQKYIDFLKQLESYAKDTRIEFGKDPSQACKRYIDILKIVSKNYNRNYDKDDFNNDGYWYSDINNLLKKEVGSSELTISDCLKFSEKFKNLSYEYKNLSDKLYSTIKTKSKAGIDTKNDRKLLTLIGKIESDIRKQIMMLTPSIISRKGSVKEKLKLLLADPRTSKLAYIAASLGIGVVAGKAYINKMDKTREQRIRYEELEKLVF